MIELMFGISIGFAICCIFPAAPEAIRNRVLGLLKHDHCEEKGKK